MPIDADLLRAAALLRPATRVATLSGAGLSKASGIPTYRDAGGLWTQGGTPKFSDVANLRADPAGFLAFWAARREEIVRAEPNAGHRAMAALQALKPGTTHITQNVDGLLDRAGCRGVLELHGRLMRSRCDACMRGFGEDAPASTRCPDCGGLVRPDIVMFGEELPHVVHADAELASKRCEVFVLVGTSAVVHPAAGLPMRALARGAKLLVINQEPTPLDAEADAVLRGRAEELLPALVEALS